MTSPARTAGLPTGWLALSLTLGLASLLSWGAVELGASRQLLDWQPGLVWREPWRWFTAAVVHLSPMHLGGNLLALGLVAWLGMAAPLPRRCAWAWLGAIPLCHLALLAQPEVLHYGGLSGISHAGVAIAVTELVINGNRSQHRIAVALGIGLLAKIWSESPWGTGLRIVPGWDIAVVPWAHASGVLAGIGTSLAAIAWGHAKRRARRPPP
jgi:rhomboid family GlyGly-CTERM serine protease